MATWRCLCDVLVTVQEYKFLRHRKSLYGSSRASVAWHSSFQIHPSEDGTATQSSRILKLMFWVKIKIPNYSWKGAMNRLCKSNVEVCEPEFSKMRNTSKKGLILNWISESFEGVEGGGVRPVRYNFQCDGFCVSGDKFPKLLWHCTRAAMIPTFVVTCHTVNMLRSESRLVLLYFRRQTMEESFYCLPRHSSTHPIYLELLQFYKL
jgi:hypothetical protein